MRSYAELLFSLEYSWRKQSVGHGLWKDAREMFVLCCKTSCWWKSESVFDENSNVRESALLMVYWVLESISVLIHIDILKCLVVNSDYVQTMFRLFRPCSDYIQTMFRLCSFNKMIFYLTTMCIIWFKSEHSLNIVWI